MIMDYTLLNANNMNTVNVITQITYLLFLLLVLAIFVERTVEIFMSIMKYADLKLGWYRFWNKQAEKFRDRLDRLYNMQGSDTDDKRLLYRWMLWNLVSAEPYKGGKAVITATSAGSLPSSCPWDFPFGFICTWKSTWCRYWKM